MTQEDFEQKLADLIAEARTALSVEDVTSALDLAKLILEEGEEAEEVENENENED